MPLDRAKPVLVLDDSAAIRSRLSAYLHRLGFDDVRTAENIDQAMREFGEADPDLVFVDLVIDEERGADFTAAALDEKPMANVVIVTALPPGHEQVTAAISQGARDYLSKPVTLPGLEALLQRLDRAIEAEDSVPQRTPPRDASYG